MKLNKLFKQFKIRKKLAIAFTALAVVPMSLTGLFGLIYTVGVLEENSLQQLEGSISTMRVKVERFLNEAQNDIFYLRDSHVFRQFINSLSTYRGAKSKEWQNVVEEQFRDFAANRRIYYQLRFLDRRATEVFRIEYERNHAVIIPAERLTRRQDVFYLYYAKNRVVDRELLYTPVELRSETRPETIVPAISYFVPVYGNSNDDRLQGVLVANVYAQKLFDILKEQPLSQGRRTLLADKNGYYLFHSEKQEWNKLLALRKEGNIGQDFPDLVSKQILSGKRGLIDEKWDEIIAYAPIFFSGLPDNFLVLVHCISRDLIHLPTATYTKTVLLFGAFIFGTALLLGFLGANQFTKPIKALSKGSEMLAQGNLDYQITIDTNDEIGQLGIDFNRMAADLKKHETEHMRVQEELKTLSAAIEQSPAVVIITDRKGNIEYVNPKFCEGTGYSAEEVLGKNPRILQGGEVPKQVYKELWKTILSGNVWRGEFHNKKKNGEFFWEEASISAIYDDNGNITHFIGLKENITERKQAEEENAKLEDQLRRSQKLETIGTLAGGIAHDFNNILTPIMGYADMALSELPSSSPLHEDLEHILTAAIRAKELVGQILLFSRQIEKERQPLGLHLIVNEALKLLRPSIPTTIEIRQRIDTPSDKILADATQMHQVIVNLCTNAWQAMQEKGGVLTIELKQVKVAAATAKLHPNLKEEEYVRLTVSDTGTGMDHATQDRIFEPFFTTQSADKGTGMGLAVVHGIVRSHHGGILVDSAPGKGSTFQVYLPTVKAKVGAAKEEQKAIAGGQESILVLDDDKAVANVIKRMLQQLGYKIDVYTSSIEALKTFRQQPDKYDLVISDLTMPNMTGLDLSKQLQKIRSGVPVIIMTGYGDTLDEDTWEIYGIQQVIGKPIVKRDVASAIRKVLDG